MSANLHELNTVLFEELTRLNNGELLEDTENMDKEIQRSKAITGIAQTIINNANTILEAQKIMSVRKDSVPQYLIGVDND